MKVKYKRVRDNAVIPTAATELSGGLDLTAAHIEQGETKDEMIVYLGLAMQPPPGYMIRFSPRSSFTKHRWILQNSPTLGDADFTGEYRLRFRAIPSKLGILATMTEENSENVDYSAYTEYDEFPYKVGDRVAQMWLEEIIPVEFEEGELENLTDRVGGFGSTGK